MTQGIYERGKEAILYATFVDDTGAAATLSGTPVISIFHYKSEGTITDVNSQDMTQLNTNTYYYKHHLPKNCDQGAYVARFSGTIDGVDVIGEQTFQVVEKNWYKDSGKGGGGIIKTTTHKEVWTQQEKTSVLESIIELKRSIDELRDIETPVSYPPDKLDTRFQNLQKAIGAIEFEQYDDSQIKTEIKNLRENLQQDIKKLEFSKEEIDELKEDTSNLLELLLKVVPDDKLEEFKESLQNDQKEIS